jgi:hypothetical protein
MLVADEFTVRNILLEILFQAQTECLIQGREVDFVIQPEGAIIEVG